MHFSVCPNISSHLSFKERRVEMQGLADALNETFPQVVVMEVMSSGLLIDIPEGFEDTTIPEIERIFDCKVVSDDDTQVID